MQNFLHDGKKESSDVRHITGTSVLKSYLSISIINSGCLSPTVHILSTTNFGLRKLPAFLSEVTFIFLLNHPYPSCCPLLHWHRHKVFHPCCMDMKIRLVEGIAANLRQNDFRARHGLVVEFYNFTILHMHTNLTRLFRFYVNLWEKF